MSAVAQEGGHQNGEKKTKSGTKLERCVWMTRTSDIHGSHLKTDLDSYLTLIRRKIHEKCATTVELMTQIRRQKIGDSGHVTPNEFRFTLIKFGVILPQPLVDRVFNVFDSDRSGTMDFDEFATWIMNSEFRPSMGKKNIDPNSTPEQILRQKLAKCINDYPRVFSAMKKQVSFLEFVSDINRTGIPLTEKEARTIFQLLDPKDCGFVESNMFKIYAQTGRVTAPPQPTPSYDHVLQPGALKEIINRVVGRNTRQLENAFSHIVRGSGVKLPYEEFRRCLMNGGGNKNPADCKELFMALGGRAENLADVDLFFNNIQPILDNPDAAVSLRPAASAEISTSRADRRLRDSLRKCFHQVKADLEREDVTGSGFVAAERLYKIIVKRCTPIAFEDFRFIVQQIRKEPGTDRIDYQHFLHGYNPSIPPHQLQGLSTLKLYADEQMRSSQGHTHGNAHGLSRSLTLNRSQSLAQSAPNSPFRLNSLDHTKSFEDNNNNNNNNSSKTMSRAKSSGALSLENPELRAIWHNVLRECHRADPQRSGQINRTSFLTALQRADNGRNLTPESMNALADKYLLSNGLVNYLLLFRNFLQDITHTAHTPQFTTLQSTNTNNNNNTSTTHELQKVHPWEFGYEREDSEAELGDTSNNKNNSNNTINSAKPGHKHPYWEKALTMPLNETANKSLTHNLSLSSLPLPLTVKDGSQISSHDRELILAKYDSNVHAVCARCFAMFAPIWRPLRNDFKKQQVPTQRGNILATHFISVLEAHGLSLTKKELGLIVRNFRGQGMEDIVKYDDFLRVCMLMKSN